MSPSQSGTNLMVKARFPPSKMCQLRVSNFGWVTSQLCVQWNCLLLGTTSIMNCFDGTVSSTLATNNQPQVVFGKMAEDAELRTYSKHHQPREQAGYSFQAFARMYLGSWLKNRADYCVIFGLDLFALGDTQFTRMR